MALSQHGETQSDLPARIFLDFQYPEMKDLLKHFLTLILGSLVFSVTFSEKVVGFSSVSITLKFLMSVGWLCLLAALGFCGAGLYKLYLTAVRAQLDLAAEESGKLHVATRVSYRFPDLAGISFGLGLLLLVMAGILRMMLGPDVVA